VAASDANHLGPSNGSQVLSLTVTAAPSYSLKASALNPSSVSAGNAATSTITVTPANGYTGSVTLSCSSITGGSPAPTCSFNPAVITISGSGSGTSTLTVSTTSSTSLATYSITVAAIDANQLGPSNGSQVLSLTVTAAPSYSLKASALNPSSVSAGNAATSTITVTPANGYTGSVTLSCSSITGGTHPPTCAFSPSVITISGSGSGTSTLTVSTTSSTSLATYSITVSAVDANQLGPSNGSQALSLTVTAAASYSLGATALSPASVAAGGSATSTITVTPANGYTGSVTLSCSSITGGTPAPTCSFNPSVITISGSSSGTSTLTVSSTSSTAVATYSITVSASDANHLGPSNGSQLLSLTVTAAPSYSLKASALDPATVTAGKTATSTITITPADGYTGSVTLSCSSVTGGTPAPTCSFNPATVDVTGAAGTSTLTLSTTTSTPGGSYTVVVAASDANHLGPSDGSQTLAETIAGAITNVVIIFQENRTPDNLFQGLCITGYGSPGACSTTPTATQYNIQTSDWANNQVSGGVTQPGVIDLGTTGNDGNYDNYDISHQHVAFTNQCDLNSANACVMDGSDLNASLCSPNQGYSCPANPTYFYVDPADVTSYLQMAQTYAFGDQMFQTNEGPSYSAHQFIISGTSTPGTADSGDYVSDFVSENPIPNNATAGCLAATGTYAKIINPEGAETPLYNLCYEHQTLTDLLDDATPPITWRYYAPSAGSIWTAPTAINHMCVPNNTYGSATECSGSDYTAASPKVVLNQTQTNAQVLSDITSNSLQQVSWVIPTGADSDHAASNDGCGPSWVTEVVNAIGNSSYWPNTVIIVSWDDWGGWYDHVAPPQVIDDGSSWGSGYVYGFRVPLIVISPYSKSAYISHTTHDFGSILRFIENNYGLGQVGVSTGNYYADTYAPDAPNSLSDMFDFTGSPVPFTKIAVPWNDATCKSNPSIPSDPDDD
jgi:phospholipase C